ncbi:MAG: hypothetical protein Q9164_005416 [Protoblastenia rupestris]
MSSNKHKSINHIQYTTPKSYKQSSSHHHSQSHKRKNNAASSHEPPSTPPPTDSEEGSQATHPSPSSKRIKTETSPSPDNLTPSKTPAIDSTYNTIIFIYVSSPSNQKFGIHKGLLCKASPLFQSALTAGVSTPDLQLFLSPPTLDDQVSPEPSSPALYLPSTPVETFTRFNHFLYSGTLTLDNESVRDLSWADVIEIYLFATKFAIAGLQNACIDVTITKQSTIPLNLPNAENMNRLWRPDTGAALLRQLFLKLYAQKADLGLVMGGTGCFHRDFMRGLVVELYSMKQRSTVGVDIKGGKKREGKDLHAGGGMDFWKVRKRWYVSCENDPVVVE